MKLYTNVHSLTDGFGESLKFIIYSILYAEYNNGEFHYYPFQPTLEHNYDNDPLFLTKKEELMKFKDVFQIANTNKYKYEVMCKFTIMHFFEITGHKFIFESKLFNKCKEIFYNTSYRNIKQKYIAIHIRRMNTLDRYRIPTTTIEGCDVPDSIYEDLCNILIEKYPEFEIHIYSQGLLSDFNIFSNNPKSEKITWHLNESIESDFCDMVFADVLVVAPSAFSYSAGLYSNSKDIYYIKSYFKPLPTWYPIEGYMSTRDINKYVMKTDDGWKHLVFDAEKNVLIHIEKPTYTQTKLLEFINPN
jgi:hypothetical protein